MKKIYYTLEDMKGDLFEIIRLLNDDQFVPDAILAIGRGGYIPGVYMSQWLEKPLYAYHYSLRDQERKDKFNPDLIDACREKRVLVIDDICDEGRTFGSIKQALDQLNANSKFACLIYNIGSLNFKPDYWGTLINKTAQPAWVHYFWEEWWKTRWE